MDADSPFAVVARHQVRPPIDLEAIAGDLGLVVYFTPLGSEISGKIMRDSRRGGPSGFAIYVNSAESPNRQRFTLAHEIAHYILHRDLINVGVIDDTMYRSMLSSQYEVQANRMAADILMPAMMVRKYQGALDSSEELARKFRVSPGAMKIRLDGLKA